MAHLKFFDAKLEAFPALTKSSSWSAMPIEPKFSFNAGAGFCRGSSTSQSTPHKRVKGYSYFKSNKAHNKLQHSLNGNTTLRLAMYQDHVYPRLELSLHHLIPISPPTIPRNTLLKLRPAPSTVEEVLPKIVSSRDPRLVFKGSAQKANPQRGGNGQQPDQSTPPSSKQRQRRTGRRIRSIDPQGTFTGKRPSTASSRHTLHQKEGTMQTTGAAPGRRADRPTAGGGSSAANTRQCGRTPH